MRISNRVRLKPMTTARDRLSSTTRWRRRRARVECPSPSDHAYGPTRPIGGGIRRRVCDLCGHITIDLTEAKGSDPFE